MKVFPCATAADNSVLTDWARPELEPLPTSQTPQEFDIIGSFVLATHCDIASSKPVELFGAL